MWRSKKKNRETEKEKVITIRLCCTSNTKVCQVISVPNALMLQSDLQGDLSIGDYFTLMRTDSIWSSKALNHLKEEMFYIAVSLCLACACVVLV